MTTAPAQFESICSSVKSVESGLQASLRRRGAGEERGRAQTNKDDPKLTLMHGAAKVRFPPIMSVMLRLRLAIELPQPKAGRSAKLTFVTACVWLIGTFCQVAKASCCTSKRFSASKCSARVLRRRDQGRCRCNHGHGTSSHQTASVTGRALPNGRRRFQPDAMQPSAPSWRSRRRQLSFGRCQRLVGGSNTPGRKQFRRHRG